MIYLTIPFSMGHWPKGNGLPPGYRLGAHQRGEGWSGHWVIRECDGAVCTGKFGQRDDAPTAEDIDAAIAAEATVEG